MRGYTAAVLLPSQAFNAERSQCEVAGADLLALEDVLVELLLQALIGQVDAQLLKAVELEALKAVDVQDADVAVAARPGACRAQ